MKCWICEQCNGSRDTRSHAACSEKLTLAQNEALARIREEAAREAKPKVKSLGQVAIDSYWSPMTPSSNAWEITAAAVVEARLRPPDGKTLGEVLYSALGGWNIPDQNVMNNYDGAAKRFLAALGPQEAKP